MNKDNKEKEPKKNSTLSGRGGFKGGIKPKIDNPCNQGLTVMLTKDQKLFFKEHFQAKLLRSILDFCMLDKNLERLKEFIKQND